MSAQEPLFKRLRETALFCGIGISKTGIIVSIADALPGVATGLAFGKVTGELHGYEILSRQKTIMSYRSRKLIFIK